jgi:hypothetical protein
LPSFAPPTKRKRNTFSQPFRSFIGRPLADNVSHCFSVNIFLVHLPLPGIGQTSNFN